MRLADVSGGYGGSPVLSRIAIEVRSGEACALLGPNGAGKSTVLRAVMGLLPQLRGSIEACGEEISNLAVYARARRGIAYIPEGRGVLNTLTVFDNLRLGARLSARRRNSREIDVGITRILERFPALEGRLGQQAGTLSGGEQQMLVLARALIGQPKVLLVDEPSLGLAPRIRHVVAGLIEELAREDGLTVLLAEQDVSLASRCVERAYVLRGGSVVTQLTREELADTERIRHLYLSDLAPANDSPSGS